MLASTLIHAMQLNFIVVSSNLFQILCLSLQYICEMCVCGVSVVVVVVVCIYGESKLKQLES